MARQRQKFQYRLQQCECQLDYKLRFLCFNTHCSPRVMCLQCQKDNHINHSFLKISEQKKNFKLVNLEKIVKIKKSILEKMNQFISKIDSIICEAFISETIDANAVNLDDIKNILSTQQQFEKFLLKFQNIWKNSEKVRKNNQQIQILLKQMKEFEEYMQNYLNKLIITVQSQQPTLKNKLCELDKIQQKSICRIDKGIWKRQKSFSQALNGKKAHQYIYIVWIKKLYKIPQQLKLLVNLQHLTLNNSQIKKMENLQFFLNLESLNLSNNKITKIQNLQKLEKLSWLDLHNNCIQIIQGLTQNINLIKLNLAQNDITQIGFIFKLEQLRQLNLYKNTISLSKQQNNKLFQRISSSEGKLNPLKIFLDDPCIPYVPKNQTKNNDIQ